MIVQLMNDMTIQSILAVVPDTVAYAYYVFLMAIGSLIVWRVR